MDKKILLVGVVSSVSKTLKKELKVVLKALSCFDQIDIFLVESDSIDNTSEILAQIKSKNENFEYRILGKLRRKLPNRIERIAFCRNVYVKHIRDHYADSNWNYIAVADLDGMNFKLKRKGILSCFESKINWDGVSANQKFGYYDIYALRAKDWVDKDCFEEIIDFKKTLVPPKSHTNSILNFVLTFNYYDKIRRKFIYDKMKILKNTDNLIKVYSAFGGFALYKPHVFLKSEYGSVNGIESEHVYLHRNAGRLKSKFYINPRLVNNYFNPYNLNRFYFMRILREIYKYFKLSK
jgi:hypothetical protein